MEVKSSPGNRIVILDSVRGMAALIVVFHHLYSVYFNDFKRVFSYELNLLFGFISEMNLEAVLFFFVISGFSIKLNSNKLNLNSDEGINKYFYKRFKRILPPYYISLIIAGLIAFIFFNRYDNSLSLYNLAGNIFFLQTPGAIKGNWFLPYAYNGVLWSLSFEMFFYFLYPCCCRYIYPFFDRILNIKTGISEISKPLFYSFIISGLGFVTNYLIPNPISSFLSMYIVWYAGVFAAEIYLSGKNYKIEFGILFLLLSLSFLLFLVINSSIVNSWFKGFGISIILLVLYQIRKYRFKIVQIAEKSINVIFSFYGKGSYSIYLFHYPFVLLTAYLIKTGTLQYFYQSIIFVLILISIIPFFEDFLVKRKFSFLQFNYSKFFPAVKI